MLGKVGGLFKEITLPLKVVRRNLDEKKSFYKSLFVRGKSTKSESLPVSKSTTRIEFKKRLNGIMLHKAIVGVFFLYSLLYSFFGDGFLSYFNSLLISAFFLVSYVMISYKVFIALEYYNNWDARFTRRKINIKTYANAAINNPLIMLPKPIK